MNQVCILSIIIMKIELSQLFKFPVTQLAKERKGKIYIQQGFKIYSFEAAL